MILTNLSEVPGRSIETTLGIAFGYASVKEARKGKLVIETEKGKWPWAETPEHFEALFREAERRLSDSGAEAGADAIIKVEGKLTRDYRGNPEIVLIGTSVKLAPPREGGPAPPRPEVGGSGSEVGVTLDGSMTTWTTPSASPSEDVVRMIQEKGKMQVEAKKEEDAEKDLVEGLGITIERARMLIQLGLDSIGKIAEAEIGLLTSIDGVNPTQARIIRDRAKELKKGSGE